MKVLNLLSLMLFFITSVAYADVVSDLQTKKNNTQKMGISYTVIVSGDSENDPPIECVVTEKGNNKLFEPKQFEGIMYLVCDNKLYQIPTMAKTEKTAPIMVSLFDEQMKKDIDDENEKFTIPDYKGSKIVGRVTENGYICQVLQKVVSSDNRETEDGEKFTTQELLKFYVIEKNGYPTTVEVIYRNLDAKGKQLSYEITNTTKFVNFNTNISKQITSLPKNAMVVDPMNRNSFDINKIKQMQLQMLRDQYGDDEE